jgi:hypothetical protein
MTCQTVDDTNPYHSSIVREECVDPFEWDNKTNMCRLKNGSYCLPTRILPVECNAYTGIRVLAQGDTGSGYQWNCVCRDPTKFTGPSCTNIEICGMMGANADTENPYPRNKRGLVNAGNSKDYWSSRSKWDPVKDGVCQCAPDETYDPINKACLPNQCGAENAQDPTDPTKCKCMVPGMIDCSLIAYTSDGLGTYSNGACKVPSCVPDPCGGRDGNAGHYDVSSGACMCNPGYDRVDDPTSPVGQVCVNVCEQVQNQNICGNRGDCFFYKIDNVAAYFRISCNQDTTTKTCADKNVLIQLRDTPLYLSFNGTQVQTATTGTPFVLQPRCDPSAAGACPAFARSFSTNTEYLVMTGDGKSYIDLSSGTIVTDQAQAAIKLINTGKAQTKSTSIEAQIFCTMANAYLSIDSSNRLTTIKNFTQSARCQNCRNGFSQDASMMCGGGLCNQKGSSCEPGSSANCCPGLSCNFSVFPSGHFCS